jgi:hypothetical protein
MAISNPFEEILNELEEIKAVMKTFKQPETPVIIYDSITKDQAIDHLANLGLPMTSSQFYKLSSNGTLPCERIGKRLIFSRKKLCEYIESRKYRRVTPDQKAAQLLAKSATKKLNKAQS